MFKYYTLFIISVMFFLYGFFPVNDNISSSSNLIPTSEDPILNVTSLYYPEIDKLVFIVIDALRTDFISEVFTPFIFSESSKNGCTSELKVESPTVTLPRIKALISGNVPQFVDVLFNLAASEETEDSFLYSAKAAGKNIVFYGDETWLKLYPNMFLRSEGTSSFYVNDFFEVDLNVTRNVRYELKQNDWDIMILHYLGLDHIGHVSGPFSAFVHPKMLEMDEVVESIYETVQTWKERTLILITGDHGMKDSGGHGGSTLSEINVPLVALGTNCSKEKLLQIDMACTITSILGLSLPSTSIGTIATNLLESLSLDRLLYILRYNYIHLSNKLNICEDTFEKVEELHKVYLKTKQTETAKEIKEIYMVCSNKISLALIKASVKEDAYVLLLSAALSVFWFFKIICWAVNVSVPRSFNINAFVLLLVLVQLFTRNYLLLLFACTCLILVCVYHAFLFLMKISSFKNIAFRNLPLFFTCLHAFSFFSSSYIEEEHQIWYFYAVSVIIFGIVANTKTSSRCFCIKIILLVGFRFVSKLNQTGDKWAHVPDIAFWLHTDENYVFLLLFFAFSLFLTLVCCLESAKKFNVPLIGAILLFIFYFRLGDHDATTGKLIWLLIFVNFLFDVKNILVTWLLVGALLLRPHNVILLSFGVFASKTICKSVKDENLIQIFHLWLANCLFFCQGHGNSLASIDIMSGYVGLSSYVPNLVISQVLCHTYMFPILIYIFELNSDHSNKVNLNIYVIHRTFAMIITLMVALIQRHHLFVWSVFAPKLLIEASHSIVLYILLMFNIIYRKVSK